MDKSLFIDSLTVDDNRNIKKLFSIMDLARQTQTIDSLIFNIEIAYNKLASYHNGKEQNLYVKKNMAVAPKKRGIARNRNNSWMEEGNQNQNDQHTPDR